MTGLHNNSQLTERLDFLGLDAEQRQDLAALKTTIPVTLGSWLDAL